MNANGRQVKRRISPKRKPGTLGLTRAQAETAMRKLMAEVTTTTTARAGKHLGVEGVGARYVAHLRKMGGPR